ncbi:MAG: LytR C-terminal domain-containing protein [Acidimicrobiia bacterium]
MLVAVAVIIGIVLLQAIDDGNDGSIGDGGANSTTTSTTTSSGTDTTGSTATSSTTAKATVLPPAQVTVRVLNGSGVSGAATNLTNTLKAKGYKTLVPTDAPARTGSVVDTKTGRTAECTAVVAFVPNSKTQPMPNPVPGGQDADCIVVLGS